MHVMCQLGAAVGDVLDQHSKHKRSIDAQARQHHTIILEPENVGRICDRLAVLMTCAI